MASAAPSTAGVFLTQWDAFHRGANPDQLRLWLPCQPTDWCHWLVGDAPRFAATVANREAPGLWDSALPGFVVSPAGVHIRCAYSADASSQGGASGCPEGADLGLIVAERRFPDQNSWCTERATTVVQGMISGCAWRPSQLDQAMQQQLKYGGRYNELVLNYAPFVARLPDAVAAIFVLQGSSAHERDKARRVQNAFCHEFNLTAASGPPVVMYDPTASPDEPFQRL